MTAQLQTAPGAVAPTAQETGRLVVAGDWTRLVVATLARILLCAILGSLLWTAIPALFGWTTTTVMSDSMAPRVRTGDVVVSMPVEPSQLTVGRVLLVEDPDHADRLRLHRFVGLTDDKQLITRGDANAQDDSTPVSPDAVVGVAVIRAPWVGLPFVWSNEQRWGLVAAAAAAVVAMIALSGIDAQLRRERDEHDRIRPRARRRGPRAELAVGATALVVVAGLVAANGAHAAFSANVANPASTLTTASDFACWPTTTAADSAVFYYRFDEAAGTSAVDRSGNTRTGTIGTGAARVAGGCLLNASPALQLSAATTSNVLVGTPTATNPNEASVEAWIKVDAGAAAGRIVGYSNGTVRDHELTLTGTGRIAFKVGSSTVTTTAADLRDGQWHHVVATQYPGLLNILLGSLTVYVDGTSAGSISSLGGYNSATVSGGSWRIGTDGSAVGIVGHVDNAAAYASTLSQTQVTAHRAVGH